MSTPVKQKLAAAALALWFLGAPPAGGSSQGDADVFLLRIIPGPVVVGHTAVVEIDGRSRRAPVVGMQARFRERILPVFAHPTGEPGRWVVLVGVPYYSQPGIEPVVLEWTDREGFHRTDFELEIRAGRFDTEQLRVQPSKVRPDPQALERIRRERAELGEIYAVGHPRRLWEVEFQLPAQGPITSPFGTRRLMNGKLQSYHSGVDFRAPVGEPVVAANRGVVRLAKELFYSGNHVIVDHGRGLFTGYSHLSRFSVRPGQRVEKGQLLGLAGATGRVNGPHLHWSAKVNGTNVNPLELAESLNRLFEDPSRDETAVVLRVPASR